MSRLNDGSRPSRLRVGQALVGEGALPANEAQHPAAEAWRAEVAAAQPPPFDAAKLRGLAANIEDRPRGAVVPLFPKLGWVVAAVAALAAVLFFVVRPPPPPTHRAKGTVTLGVRVLRDGSLLAENPEVELRSGDRVQFSYQPGPAASVVLVGVDGSGTVQTYWPDEGDTPVPVVPGEAHVLDGSILLDDAPGPEVFVAGFGRGSASAVAEQVREAFELGGVAAVEALEAEHGDIAVLVLEKE